MFIFYPHTKCVLIIYTDYKTTGLPDVVRIAAKVAIVGKPKPIVDDDDLD